MSRINRLLRILEHPARTAIAATVSLLAARLCRLPESYWAAITTLIIMQSTLGSALTVSGQRLTGTAMGAVAGAAIATFFKANVLTYAVGIFAVTFVCSFLGLGKAAVRFSGITLTIVMLVAHNQNYWTVAIHRFVEVSIGILIGLAVTAAWPHPDSQESSGPGPDHPAADRAAEADQTVSSLE